MSDLRTLHDAFAELERRADAAGTAPITRPRRAVRLVPVAATVVAVAGLVAGAMWLVPGDQGTPVAGTSSTAAPATTTGRDPVPTSPADLIDRFGVVLGDTATFKVTQEHTVPAAGPSRQPGTAVTSLDGPGHALIAGTLTAEGGTGSFSLTIYPGDSDPRLWCSPFHTDDCAESTLPDGSRLVTGTAEPGPGAVSHLACVKRPDGATVLMYVGNQEDPRGAVVGTPGGDIVSPRPPLTLEQLTAIVTSDRW